MSTIAIAGGHGQIAMLLHPLLRSRGDTPRGIIRNPAQADDLRAAGAEPVACDLEAASVDAVAEALAGADAVVFAAGAGPGSGSDRKFTMDRDGAIKLIEAARLAGISRYVMVSAMGAKNEPPPGGGVFGDYLQAKYEADRALEASGLDYTIVRPGRLTDDPATGLVRIAPELERGAIPRADVAAVIAAVLVRDAAIGKAFDLTSGDAQVEDALVFDN